MLVYRIRDRGAQAPRALNVFLFFVIILTAVEYLVGFILDASPLYYIYTPYIAKEPSIRNTNKEAANWSQAEPSTHLANYPDDEYTTEAVTQNINKNHTKLITVIRQPNQYVNASQFSKTMKMNYEPNPESVLYTEIMSSNDKIEINVTKEKEDTVELPLCTVPPDVGYKGVNKIYMDLDDVEKKYPQIQWGGRYSPSECTPQHKVAIIVPYRDRMMHLAIFLNNMHPFLMKQRIIKYGIFIVEQNDNEAFNRAKLMNVGFMESQKLEPGGWQCFIFHDIDLLPLDTRNLYSCPNQPRHMSAAIDMFNFELPYSTVFGGVSAMTLEQFIRVNGFSNMYWGWGGEDDDMSYRLI